MRIKTSYLWPFLGHRSLVCSGRKLILCPLLWRSSATYCEMIPPWIREQLFQAPKSSDHQRKLQEPDTRVGFSEYSDNLSPFQKSSYAFSYLQSSDVHSKCCQGFDLPGIASAGDLSSYFLEASSKQVDRYLQLLKDLICDLPPVPQVWLFEPGWMCYKSSSSHHVQFPDCEALILDVEVCVKESFAPVLATAVSPQAWYCWVSPNLCEKLNHSCRHVPINDLTPLGVQEDQKCVVVGHNVVYDSARVQDSYKVSTSGLRFFDTMAAHISISGISNLQKFQISHSDAKMPWAKLASGNSLDNLYHLYCGRYLDKSKRNIFVDGSSEDIRQHFQELTCYCAGDVVATHAIFCKLFPLLMERFPHPATLAAMLEMSAMFMPIHEKWPCLLQEEKSNIFSKDSEINFLLRQIAQERCELLHENKYSNDPWMWDQNWTVKYRESQTGKKNWKDSSETDFKDHHGKTSESNIPSRLSVLHYPEWYRKISVQDNSNFSVNENLCLTFGMNITPKLLRLCWGPYPLHYIRGFGWGMLVPSFEESVDMISCFDVSLPVESIYKMCTLGSQQHERVSYQNYECYDVHHANPLYQDFSILRENIENANSKVGDYERYPFSDCTTEVKLHNGILFRKLPHYQGIGRNVGSPFSKDLITNPALSSRDTRGQQVLYLLRQKQFWNKYGNKLDSSLVVWFGPKSDCGAIIPETVVTGDFTRHPKEKLLSAILSEEQGSRLCRALTSPPGWWFLSAVISDVDLWMASLLSDSIFGSYGSTRFGEKVLNNSYYSSIANVMEITEEQARWLSRAVLYGAKRGFISRLLRQIDPSLTKPKALGRADRLLEYLLGNSTSVESVPNQEGIQADLWLKLKVAASKLHKTTPILSSRLSRVLESDTEKFSALAMSWIIQSSSVDFLHLLLTCFRDLAPSARLSMISSSELRIYYLVPDGEKYQAAKALHLAHLYAKAYCASCVGMSDLPLASALLPSVQLSHFLKPTSQDTILTLNFYDAHELSESFECVKRF